MLLSVYRPLGYIHVVHELAERSMNIAINRFPDYSQSGEVYYMHLHVLSSCGTIYVDCDVFGSGSSLMLDMTRLPMLIIPLCHVVLGGIEIRVCVVQICCLLFLQYAYDCWDHHTITC